MYPAACIQNRCEEMCYTNNRYLHNRVNCVHISSQRFWIHAAGYIYHIYTRAHWGYINVKDMGTIFFALWPFEIFGLLHFDYVKTADFRSENFFSLYQFFIIFNFITMCFHDFLTRNPSKYIFLIFSIYFIAKIFLEKCQMSP